MKHLLIPGFLLAYLAVSPLVAAAAPSAAKPVAPKATLSARVATGARVQLVPSARTPAQWAVQRPHFEDLRPRVRSASE